MPFNSNSVRVVNANNAVAKITPQGIDNFDDFAKFEREVVFGGDRGSVHRALNRPEPQNFRFTELCELSA